MQPMAEGVNLDPSILAQVTLNKIAQQEITNTQMEAAIQQLTMENASLKQQLADAQSLVNGSDAEPIEESQEG